MDEQLIISIGREFGSGGHAIGEILAQRFELPLYDNNLLKEITTARDLDLDELEKYDELPKRPIFSRSVRGFSNSPEENIAALQFNYIKNLAAEGKSFVIIGRCGETVLKNFSCLVSIFVLADHASKVRRIKNKYDLTYFDAEDMLKQKDMERKSYHNSHCPIKWGDSRNYDITINSSRLGIEGTADLLEMYIRERIKNSNKY
jgi:cytidylate kinase